MDMSFKNRLIIMSSIGFGVGVIVGVLITAFSATLTYGDGSLYLCSKEFIEAVGDPLIAFTIQAFLSGIYGVFAMGGSSLYAIEEWSIAKCTLIHYLAVMIGYYVLAFTLRWFSPKDFSAIITILVIMTAVYFVIWLVNILSYKAQLKQINSKLKELRVMEKKVTE